MKFVKISSAVIGTLMIVQWVFFIVTGNVPQFESAPVEISFHISIELLTALLLIYAALICKKRVIRQTLLLFGQGMVAYTVVNSSGYFAQSGEWIFVAMFAVLLGISIYNTWVLFRQRKVE